MSETVSYKETEEDAKRKIENLLWSADQARVVAEFLKGSEVDIAQNQRRSTLWQSVASSSDFESDECRTLLDHTKSFQATLPSTNVNSPKDEIDKPKEKITKDEYEWPVKTRSRVVLSILEPLLRKAGIWGVNEHRRMRAYAGFRGEGERVFSQEIESGGKITERGHEASQKGGPDTMPSIYAPQFQQDIDLSDKRTRKSLAHEVIHTIRALTNSDLWSDNLSNEAESHNLNTSEQGGYRVASNTQGSESIGLLFSTIVDMEAEGKETTIEDVLEKITPRFESGLQKLEKRIAKFEQGEKGSISSRYFSANFALVHHLNQLKAQGLGHTNAKSLLALGTYGYVSLEKVPDLIRLGVVTHDKHDRMKQVIYNLIRWFTTEKTSFRVETQNT